MQIELFGLTIYKIKKDRNLKIRVLLYGLFRYEKSNFCKDSYKEIKIFGFSVHKIQRDFVFKKTYILGVFILKQDLRKRFIKKLNKVLPKTAKVICVLSCNAGETYNFLQCFDKFVKKNSLRNICFVATKKYHCDLIKIICPEYDFVYVESSLDFKLEWNFKYNGKRFWTIFDLDYFINFEKSVREADKNYSNYYDTMLSKLNLNREDVKFKNIFLSESVKRNVIEKAQNAGLDINKFVFIAPFANSCETLSDNFWQKLINAIIKEGYDIYINCMQDKKAQYKGTKSFYLSFSEVLVLAQKAVKIIGLRSGLCEILATTKRPMDIIYTDFKDGRVLFEKLSSAKVLLTFSLKFLPIQNAHIKEYDYNAAKEDDLLNNLLEFF
jgi:hypothetical protein